MQREGERERKRDILQGGLQAQAQVDQHGGHILLRHIVEDLGQGLQALEDQLIFFGLDESHQGADDGGGQAVDLRAGRYRRRHNPWCATGQAAA